MDATGGWRIIIEEFSVKYKKTVLLNLNYLSLTSSYLQTKQRTKKNWNKSKYNFLHFFLGKRKEGIQ